MSFCPNATGFKVNYPDLFMCSFISVDRAELPRLKRTFRLATARILSQIGDAISGGIKRKIDEGGVWV